MFTDNFHESVFGFRDEADTFIAYSEGYNRVAESAKICFKQIPDDIILDMATREFEMDDENACVCGWAMKLGVEKLKDVGFGMSFADVENSTLDISLDSDRVCSIIYGGDSYDWDILFTAVTYDALLPAVEIAFVNRLNEIV